MSDELVNLIAKRFIQRRDVKAVQQSSGIYIPERAKFTRSDLAAHIAGEVTLGHYLLDSDDQCKLFAYDIDLVPSFTPRDPQDADRPDDTWTKDNLYPMGPREIWNSNDEQTRQARVQLTRELRAVADGLAARVRRVLDIDVAVAYSGYKGLHVYGFTGTAPAAEVRAAAIDTLLTTRVFKPTRGDNFFRHTNAPEYGFPNVEIEVYPKQDSLGGKDLGNLMRLPLGVNRNTGNKCFFVDVGDTNQRVITETDPYEVLAKGLQW